MCARANRSNLTNRIELHQPNTYIYLLRAIDPQINHTNYLRKFPSAQQQQLRMESKQALTRIELIPIRFAASI